MTGHKIAIVADEAGTTRDISEFEYTDEKHDLTYILADSGGLDYGSSDDEVAEDIVERTEKAIAESDILLWVIEYDRFTKLDEDIAKILRKAKRNNIIILANKADNKSQVMESWSQAGRGEKEFFPVSSSHNSGLGDVKRYIAKFLTEKWLNYKKELDDTTLKIAFIGRPNVGKSSLVNAIVGSQRVMVKDMSGTTRDAVDTKFTYLHKKLDIKANSSPEQRDEDESVEFTLIDTAGIRRLSKVWTRNIENWSVMRSERALRRADVVAIVIDGFDGVVQQDLSLISEAIEEKKWLIIIVNKWDKVLEKARLNSSTSMSDQSGASKQEEQEEKSKMMLKYIDYLKEKIEFISWASIIFTSATEKKRVSEILDEAIRISAERGKRVKTSIMNEFLEQAVYHHPPTGNKKSHSPKIYYGSQVDTHPPKFIISVNNPDHFHFSYKRYLENKIRDNFGFEGTPIVIEYKGRGKYKDVKK